MKREWTEQQRRRVLTLASKGYSAGVIARKMTAELREAIHGTAISRLLTPPKGPYTPDDDRAAIRILREARERGDNLEVAKREAAKLLGRTPQSVDARLRLLGEIDIGDQRDYAWDGVLKPWPVKARFDGARDTGEGSVHPMTPVIRARLIESRSYMGNSGGMCAESRGGESRTV